jgi:hypothetical protein
LKCHYIYDDEAGKTFISSCWPAVIHGPGFCTCERTLPMTFEQFEKKEFNQKIKELIAENMQLEKENARLQRIIKNLIKRLTSDRRKITP